MKSILQKSLLKVLYVFLFLSITGTSWGQASIGTLPYTRADNFNTYNPTNATTAASSLPVGWTIISTGTAYNGQGTGSGTAGGPYAYGSGSDFSLGALHSGSATVTYKVSFVNNTGVAITSLTFAWNYKQWRFAGNATGWDATGTGALSANAVLNAKDFAGAAAGTNGSGAVTPVTSFTLSGLNIGNGVAFGIQWVTNDAGGSDNGVAIDDFSMQASGASTPALTTIGTISAVNTTYGTASTPPATFTASGANLTANMLVSAPAGYEISQTAGGASGYAASQALIPSSGTVSKTIYVRLAATTVFGTYSGNITLASTGATSASIATTASTVSKKVLTVSGAIANNKVYDRTTGTTITGATLLGTVNGDNLTLSGGGEFANADAGAGKPITTNLTFSGGNATSYTLTQPSGLTATIFKKDLTILFALANNKEYDGNTEASISGTLSSVIAPDDIILSIMGSFDGSSVGTSIPVFSNSVLIGDAALNYNLLQPTGLTADITPKALTIADAVALNKVFDGNTDAIISGTLTGIVAPDEVTLTGTGAFATANIGVNIPVTSTSIITGDVSNYTLTQPTGLTATISAEALLPQTITFDSLEDVIYGSADFNLSATATSGLSVSYTSSDADVATVTGNVVTITGVGTTAITASQSGDAAYEAAAAEIRFLNVTPKGLTVTSVVAGNKIYDGNNFAFVSGMLSGVEGSDEVTLMANGTFSSINVGTAIPVSPGFLIEGSDAFNYTLIQPSGITADITAKTLTVGNAVANNKAYDGNASAIISGATLNGIVGSDDVVISGDGTFAVASVGNSISVSANLALSGTSASNYIFTQPSGLTADITPLPLTISGFSASDKIYDATTLAVLTGTPALNGIIAGEEANVALSGTAAAVFNNKNVGTNKPVSLSGFSLTGALSGNYTLSSVTNLNAAVSQKPITVSGAIANSKPYDGSAAATLSSTGTLSGVEPTDAGNVSVSPAATFASATIGNDIIVNLSLTGSEAANYSLIQPGITADITVSACGSNIVNWDFATASPSGAAVPNLTVSPLTQGNNNGTTVLITAVSASNNTGASGGNNAGAAARIGALSLAMSAYFEFKIIPATGYKATLTGINFGSRETSTGPKGYALRSSLDNFASNLASGILPANSTWIKYTPALIASSGNSGTEVTYRIYGYNGTGSPASGTANWRIDDLNLNVSLSASLSSPLNATTCSGADFTYTPTSAAAGTSFTWTRAAVSGISNAAVTVSQSNNPDEVLINTTQNPVNVIYAFQVTANNCYTTQNVTVQVLPQSAGGTISGSTTVCSGINSTTLTLSGQVGSITKWQSSPVADFSENVTDISNTATSLTVTNLIATTYYRVVVTSGTCIAALSNTASLAIIAPLTYYQDADGDGYGNQSVNYTGCAQSGYVTDNTDCNDSIAAINPGAVEIAYNGVDDNCNGSIDEGYPQITTSLLASDCNSTLASIGSLVGIQTLAPGALYTGWRIRATNGAQVQVIEKNVPHFTMMEFPSYAYATTYTIDIQLQRNGVWLGYYGPTCQISTPAVLAEGGAASVSPSQCGIVLPKINTLIATTSLAGVTGYRFRVTNLTDPLGPNAVQTIDRTQNWFSLQMLTRYNYGTTYRIEVSVKSGTGAFGGFGSPCEVSSPPAPSLVNCGGVVASGTAYVAATSLAGATQYRFQITRQSDLASATIDRNANFFTFNAVPAAVASPGVLYTVRVAVMSAGTWSPFGDACEITSPGTAARFATAAPTASSEFKAAVYPNPFTSEFAIGVTTSSDENVQVKVYDMLGKLIESREVKVSELDAQKVGDRYPSGVYNVIVSQGGIVKTLRVIKR